MCVKSGTVFLCRIKYITVYTEFLRQRSNMSHSCHHEHCDCGCDRGTERYGCGDNREGCNCRNQCNRCNGCNLCCSCCESIARALHNLFSTDCGCNRCNCDRFGCNRARGNDCGCGCRSDGATTAYGEIDVYYARQYALNGCGCHTCNTCRWTI